MNLPDGVGTTLLHRVRDEHLATQVAVTTGTTDGPLRAEALDLRPDAFFDKPFDSDKLVEWLSAPSETSSDE
jgi:DNA-binding NarL/FixJ family response regulator